MIATFVVPFLVATLNLALSPALHIFTYGPCLNWSLKFFCLPFLAFVLIILEYQNELKVKFSQKGKVDENIQHYKKSKAQTSAFIGMELAMETVPQMYISLIALLVPLSATMTVGGLESLDETKETKIEIPYFSISFGPEATRAFVILANVWSLRSCWMTLIRMMSSSKSFFPWTSKMILGLYTLLSVSQKLTSCLLFLTPCLGLFDILRHLQGEYLPYWVAMNPTEGFPPEDKIPSVYVENDVVMYGNLSFPWKKLTRFDYSDPKNPIPPPVTIYTKFNLETYLIGFWILLSIQALVILLGKKLSNPERFAALNWIEIIGNCMGNIWIPTPFQDWDHEDVAIPLYKLRQKNNNKELLCTIVIHWIFNIIFLAPIWILGKKCTYQEVGDVSKVRGSRIFILKSKKSESTISALICPKRRLYFKNLKL